MSEYHFMLLLLLVAGITTFSILSLLVSVIIQEVQFRRLPAKEREL